MANEKENTTTDQTKEQVELNDALRSAVSILTQIRSLNKESLNYYADQVSLSEQLYQNANLIATANKSIDGYMSVAAESSGIIAKRYEFVAKQTEIYRDLTGEISETYVDIVKNSDKIADTEFDKVDLSKLQNKLLEQRKNLDIARQLLGEAEYQRELEMIALLDAKINTMKELNAAQSRANVLAKQFLGDTKLTGFAFNTLIGKIEHFIEEVGGEGLVGKFLGKKAADMLEHTKHDIQHKIVAAFQESGNAGVTAFSVTKMAATSFIKYALPALGIAGLLGIFYGIIHAAGHLDEELSHIGKTFIVNRKEADKIHHLAIDLSKEMGVVGIRSEQVLNTFEEMPFMTNLVMPIKKGNEAAKQLLKDATMLMSKFGLSADEFGKIRTFAAITQKPIAQIVKESTKLGKGILTTRDAMRVITKISPSIAASFKRGTQELIKAAQRAEMLGIELEKIQSFGDGILDFEQSLQNEMEARVLTGRNINFDKARELALNNDIAGLQEEMLSQLGSMNEFSKMNRIQQQSIAKSFGMEVDSVVELLAAQEKLNSLGLTQAKLDKIQAMNAAELADEMKKTNNAKLKDYLVTLAKEKESAALNERIADVTKKIKEYLTAMLWPLIEQAHYFLDSAKGAEFLQSVVGGIKVILTAIVTTVQVIAKGVSMLSKAFGGTGAAVGIILGLLGVMATYFVGKALIVKGIGLLTAKIVGASAATQGLATSMQAVQAANGAVSGASGAAGGVGGLVSGLTPFAKNMLGISVGLIAFAGALYISAKAFQEFGKVNWDKAANGGWVMVGLITAMVVAAIVAAKAAPAIAALAGLGLAVVAFSAALLISAKGFEVMSKIKWKEGFDGMFGAIWTITKSFLALLPAVPVMLASSVALGVASGALWGFATAMSTLSKALKSLSNLGDTKAVATNIVDGLLELKKIPAMINVKEITRPLQSFINSIRNVGFDKLIEFGKLAKTDLKKAGENIVSGIRAISSLKINENLDVGTGGKINMFTGEIVEQGKGAIGAFQKINTALGKLNLKNVDILVKLATTDMSKIGTNIKAAINALASIEISDEDYKKLNDVQKIFGALNRAMLAINSEKLKDFSGINAPKLSDVSAKMKDVVYNLSQIGKMGAPGMNALIGIFESLSQAIDALNLDKLKNLANVNVDNLQKLRGVLQQPTGVSQTVSANTTTSVETETSKTSAKFDKMISLLEKLSTGGSANQPVTIVVKLGDRTLDTIATELYPKIQRIDQQRTTNTGGRTTAG